MSVINEVNNVYHQIIHQNKDVFITSYRCYDIQLHFIQFDSFIFLSMPRVWKCRGWGQLYQTPHSVPVAITY